MMSNKATLIVPPESGEVLHAFGDELQLKLSGEQTGGNLAALFGTVPPGGGPPPHVHHHEDEMFIVIEGSTRFFANGAWTENLAPGSVVYTPRGLVHTFQNTGTRPSRQWIITTPSGFEAFFSKCAKVFGVGGAPDITQIVDISTEHGIEYVPPLSVPPPPVHV